jgi:hypothetical protein
MYTGKALVQWDERQLRHFHLLCLGPAIPHLLSTSIHIHLYNMAFLVPLLLPHIVEAGANIGTSLLLPDQHKILILRHRYIQCDPGRFILRLVPDWE